MSQITVTVQGHGSFQIPYDKAQELLSWLSKNQGVDVSGDSIVREVRGNNFTGRTLINE